MSNTFCCLYNHVKTDQSFYTLILEMIFTNNFFHTLFMLLMLVKHEKKHWRQDWNYTTFSFSQTLIKEKLFDAKF